MAGFVEGESMDGRKESSKLLTTFPPDLAPFLITGLLTAPLSSSHRSFLEEECSSTLGMCRRGNQKKGPGRVEASNLSAI